MFCYPPSLFNDIPFILRYVFEYVLKLIWGTFEPNWFISYFPYPSMQLTYSHVLQNIIIILSIPRYRI